MLGISIFYGASGSDVNSWLADVERAVKERGEEAELLSVVMQSLGENVMAILRNIEVRLRVSDREYAWTWGSLKAALLWIQGEPCDYGPHRSHAERMLFAQTRSERPGMAGARSKRVSPFIFVFVHARQTDKKQLSFSW